MKWWSELERVWVNLPCSVNSRCSLCSQEAQLSSCVGLLADTVRTFYLTYLALNFWNSSGAVCSWEDRWCDSAAWWLGRLKSLLIVLGSSLQCNLHYCCNNLVSSVHFSRFLTSLLTENPYYLNSCIEKITPPPLFF